LLVRMVSAVRQRQQVFLLIVVIAVAFTLMIYGIFA